VVWPTVAELIKLFICLSILALYSYLVSILLYYKLSHNFSLDDDSVSNESWECPNCGMFAPLIVLEKWQHLHICKGELFEGEQLFYC
jgi:hypothetical protein